MYLLLESLLQTFIDFAELLLRNIFFEGSRASMLNMDFYSFGEKFIVKNIKGTSVTYVKWMRTWNYVLKQKKYFISMVPDIISPFECFGSIKKIKNSLHLYLLTCACSHWNLGKITIFWHRFLSSLRFPWHSH